jgi:DNA-binding HxlR family transcriptional regulator
MVQRNQALDYDLEAGMSEDLYDDTVCPVARALEVAGDRWTFLILRELSMKVHRFDDLQAQLGMSSHLLSTRLKKMEADRLLERRLYSERPPRYEYYATTKGKELDGVLLMLRSWGTKWCGLDKDAPAVKLRHRVTGEVVEGAWPMPEGMFFTFEDTECSIGARYQAERKARSDAFYGRKRSRSTH